MAERACVRLVGREELRWTTCSSPLFGELCRAMGERGAVHRVYTTLLTVNAELHAFLDALGTPIEPSLTGLSSRPTMPSTPSKPPTVDIAKVRQSLHELWKTEESYRRKITSLRDVRTSPSSRPPFL